MPSIIDIYRDITCDGICLIYNRAVCITVNEEHCPFEPDNYAEWAESVIAVAIRELASLDGDNLEDCAIAEDFVTSYFSGVIAAELDEEVAKQGSSLHYLGSYGPSDGTCALFDGVLDLIYDDSSNPSHEVVTGHTLH